MSESLQEMKMDDIMDVDMQAAGADDESDDGDRKDQPPAFETLGQVKPTPLQSWLIKVMRRHIRIIQLETDHRGACRFLQSCKLDGRK
jgi:hypothetical protein